MEKGRLEFRMAGQSDGARVAALHALSWKNTYRGILSDAYLDGPLAEERLRLWDSRLRAPGTARFHVTLAEVDGELAGFACVLLDDEPAWGACLDNLHVRPELHGHGIGRQLFALAVRWVLSTEPGWPLYLWLYEANSGARRFYDALAGEMAERGLKHAADGTMVPSLRYVWHDLARLLARLTAG